MCGIAGIMLRERGPIGSHLVKMCQAMRHRGADSTGFALYGEPDPERLIVRLRFPDGSRWTTDTENILAAVRELGGDQHSEIEIDDADDVTDRFVRLSLRYAGDIKRLALAIDAAAPGVETQSMGHSLEIIKDAGDADTVDARHHVSTFQGSHGLGHVRLATESIVSVAYGHPFWAEPFPDVSIVHNGQLTNYFTLRRLLEQDGFRFQTGNDSELIAVYLADKMSRGQTFYEALKESVYELDGCFAYLLSMPERIGSAKDMFAIKSIVVANIGGDTAMATEEQAIRAVYTEELDDTQHPDPRSVFVWERDGRILQEIV
jgi:glutamine phosphoribosylpyrophosphate amidotransferase